MHIRSGVACWVGAGAGVWRAGQKSVGNILANVRRHKRRRRRLASPDTFFSKTHWHLFGAAGAGVWRPIRNILVTVRRHRRGVRRRIKNNVKTLAIVRHRRRGVRRRRRYVRRLKKFNSYWRLSGAGQRSGGIIIFLEHIGNCPAKIGREIAHSLWMIKHKCSIMSMTAN